MTHLERIDAAEARDRSNGIVYTDPGSASDSGYETAAEIEAAVRAALKELPPPGDRWVGCRLDPTLGHLSVIRVRPGRTLHVVGYGPVHDRLRAAIAGGRLAGWSLQPLRAGDTPLVTLFEPLLRVCGTRRLYTPLERSGFANVEQVEATPDQGLAAITNIGRPSVPAIRQAVAEALDSSPDRSGA